MPSKTGSVAHKRVIIGKSTDKPVKYHLVTQHENLKMLTEKHNDDKLAITFLIVGAGLIAYHFWQKINGIIIIYGWWCRGECISV